MTPPRPPATVSGPRFGAAWAALAYAAATMIFAFPALTGAFLVSSTSDQYIGGYAVRTFGQEVLARTGHFAQWNPYLFGGMPYIGSMNGDIFYPPSVLFRLVLRPDVAVTWLFVVHLFLAGWLAYLFLRRSGLRFQAALIGGLAYLMSGPIASYVSPGHDGQLYVSAILPLVLLLLVDGIRDGRAWAWPAIALSVGFALLTPHPQIFQYMLLACGAFGLYLAFWSGPGLTPPRPVATRRLALALGAVLIGMAMGAVQFASVIKYIASSPRAGGGQGGYEFAIAFSMPLEELMNTYLPQFSGILDNYWGRNFIHFHSEYLGAVALFLAGCAFFGAAPERRRNVRYWLIIAIAATIWSLGGSTPLYHIVYALVPGTKFFRAPSMMFFLSAFSVAVLAAEGVENILRRAIPTSYVVTWMLVALGITLLAVSGALTTLSAGVAVPEMADRVAENQSAVALGSIRCLVFVVLAGGLVLLYQRQRITTTVAAAVLGILVAADLWSVERLYWHFSPPASVTYASDAAIDYVRAQKEPGRVLAAPLAQDVAPHDPELEGDALMIHDIRQAIGYHSNELKRYDVLAGKVDGFRPIFTAQVWRLLNVRFLLTNLAAVPLPDAKLVAGPARDAAGTTVYLYRLPGDNPPAWVTPVSVKVGDDRALATVTDARFDPLVAAIYDTAAPVTGKQVDQTPAPLGIAVSTVRYDPGHLTFRLDRPAPDGASLIVSENYYPGWQATVDGKPAPLGRADYTLIGVPLPAGGTTVDLEYHNPVFGWSSTLTLVAMIVSVLWWAGAFASERRRHG
jgi:Bacterial membrane protein YfhO